MGHHLFEGVLVNRNGGFTVSQDIVVSSKIFVAFSFDFWGIEMRCGTSVRNQSLNSE